MSANGSDEESWEQCKKGWNAALWWYNTIVDRRSRLPRLKRDREMSGAEQIIAHLEGHPMVCHERYRMEPPLFRLFCEELKSRGLESKGEIIIEELVGIFLQMVGQGATMRTLAEDFQHSEQTVWSCIRKVMCCIKKMMHDYVKMPGADTPRHPKVSEGTQYHPFKDALGAIDGTHIPAFPDSGERFKETWRNRKDNMTQNVMAAVDFDGRFVAVAAGYEGSAHDGAVLRKSIELGFKVPEGRYYLVDAGYANTHQFLSPYRGKIYHLTKFQQCRREDLYSNADELFNYRHAQLRNVVEKAFGILKARFRILKDMHPYEYAFQKDIVYACAIIHNFLMQNQHQGDDFEDDGEDTESDEEEEAHSDIPAAADIPSTSGVGANMPEGRRRTASQRGNALRDSIREQLWNAR